MQHFHYLSDEERQRIFYKEPLSFTKYTIRETLAYALGATLYIPGNRETLGQLIVEKKYPELTSLVCCLEDAIGDCEVERAEEILVGQLTEVYESIQQQQLLLDELPLLFIRVRNPEHFAHVIEKIGKLHILLTGYVFPKFEMGNGEEFFTLLKEMNDQEGYNLYGMPILESPSMMYKETRIPTLLALHELFTKYKQQILNVRVGCTDLCGLYGIRRGRDMTIYDVSVVRDFLSDMVNIFGRGAGSFLMSGPVWEYFGTKDDSFVKEITLDIVNGFIGKTIIHPTHIEPVHFMHIVSKEEYMDAMNILSQSTGEVGVVKSEYGNKMNEVKPHHLWAEKIIRRSNMYGVLHEGIDLNKVLAEEFVTV